MRGAALEYNGRLFPSFLVGRRNVVRAACRPLIRRRGKEVELDE